MLDIYALSPRDLAVLKGREHLIAGEPQPEWLRWKIEHGRLVDELRAEQRAQSGKREATGLVQRVRLAFSRG